MKTIKSLFLVTLVLTVFSACHGTSKKDHTENDSLEVVALDEAEEPQTVDITQIYGNWAITKVGGLPVDFETSLTFAEGSFGAKICNSFGGELLQKERRTDALRIGNCARTEMMGPDDEMKVEDEFARLIQEVRSFKIAGDNLQLLGDDDNVLVEAKRI